MGKTRILEGGLWQLLSLWPSPRLLTLASRLDGDLLAAVAPASRGDSSYPEQVLLTTVQVGDPVEELLWTRLILTGSLRGRAKKILRTKALGPPASNSNLPRGPGLRGGDGWWWLWKGRRDPAFLALPGFGAVVNSLHWARLWELRGLLWGVAGSASVYLFD